MEDDLSRQIFLRRLDHSISGDISHIDGLLSITVRNSSEWQGFCGLMESLKDRDTVLFGSGIWGKTLLSEFHGFPWKCIIDNDPKSADIDGIPVVRAADYLKSYDGGVIVISSYKNRDSMISQCLSSGVPEKNIIDAGDVIYALTEGRIYFDPGIPLDIGDGIFVDGGCFDGSDSRRYMEDHSGEVLCFEPDKLNIEKIEKKLKETKGRFRIIPKALWKAEEELSFSASGGCGSRIDKTSTGIKVPASSVDIETGGEKVSMIKMDIEGAELEALKGAEETIKRDHPVLAISIYHKPEDILDLPDCILSIYGEYRFYLRHYSFSWYDTVLYALP